MFVCSSRIFVASALLVALPLAASSGTVIRNTSRGGAAMTRLRIPHAAQQSRRRTVTQACSTNASASFVGISGAMNVAGGLDAGVLSGTNNVACDVATAVGTGNNNQVYGDGNTMAESSFLGGGENNEISATEAFDGAGYQNKLDGPDAFIGAGQGNSVAGFSDNAVVVGGNGNQVSNDDSFIGAGNANVISGTGSFIGAGGDLSGGNKVPGNDSFLGGGDLNAANATNSVIGGGISNDVTTNGSYGTIGGGNNNYVSGAYAGVGSGSGNKAEGAFAVIPGGADNIAAGAASFAAGYHADAAHTGSFVWSDDVSGSSVLTDTNVNQFVVRATGGTFIYSSEKLTSGVKLASGSGTWASLSDRNAKTAIVPLDDAAILAKVAALPIDAWQYKTEAGVRHVGPMAQDFYAAFGVGEDDRHITSIDEDGIALAAIKALSATTRLQRTQIAKQNGTIARQDRELSELRAQMRTVMARLDTIRAR